MMVIMFVDGRQFNCLREGVFFLMLLLLSSCDEDSLEFDYRNLPVSKAGMSVHNAPRIWVTYLPEKGVFTLGKKIVLNPEALCTELSLSIEEMDEERVQIHFNLPKDFPANEFAEICRKTQARCNGRASFLLSVLFLGGDLEMNRREPFPGNFVPSTFIPGEVIRDRSDLDSEKNIEQVTLKIGGKDFLWNGKKIRAISTIREKLSFWSQTGELMGLNLILKVEIDNEVSIQHFISTLEGKFDYEFFLLFPE